MKIAVKKLKNGFEMPVFGLGTWTMGGKREVDTSHDAEDMQAIRDSLDAGITHIDTAEAYSAGHAEELVGNVIKDYDRSKLFLVSKVWEANLHYDDLINACRKSIERLQTEYIDLYLIHAPNFDTPIEETMKALDYLKNLGLILNIGVSNFTIDQLEKAQKHTENKIVTNQIHYNLHNREHEDMVSYCQKNDIMVTAYRPVDRGELVIKNKYPVIDEMCVKYKKTSAQIAINWLVSQKNVVTISKMSGSHLQENLDALSFTMKPTDIQKLTDMKLSLS